MRGLGASPYISPCRRISTWDVCIPCHSSCICTAKLNGGPVLWLKQAQPFQLHITRLWLSHGPYRMLPQAWDIKRMFWLCHCCVWCWIMRVAELWWWCFPSRNPRHRAATAWDEELKRASWMAAGQKQQSLVCPHWRGHLHPSVPWGKEINTSQDRSDVWAHL